MIIMIQQEVKYVNNSTLLLLLLDVDDRISEKEELLLMSW